MRGILIAALPPAGARGLHEVLTALEGWIRDLSAVAAKTSATPLNVDRTRAFGGRQESLSIHPLSAARAVTHVGAARRDASANVNPQLIIGSLLSRVHSELAQAPVAADPRPAAREVR